MKRLYRSATSLIGTCYQEEANMKQSKDEFLNNMYIKDSLKECKMSEDMDPTMVLVEIILRMNEAGKAPMPLMDMISFSLFVLAVFMTFPP